MADAISRRLYLEARHQRSVSRAKAQVELSTLQLKGSPCDEYFGFRNKRENPSGRILSLVVGSNRWMKGYPPVAPEGKF